MSGYRDENGAWTDGYGSRPLGWPMAPADPYAWPGGYPIGYLVDDGEYLCAACVNDPDNPVHIGQDGESDGWRIVGLQVLEGSAADYDGAVACAHCGRELVADDDDGHDSDCQGCEHDCPWRRTNPAPMGAPFCSICDDHMEASAADDDDEPTPSEDDDYISDDRNGYNVSHCGRYVGTYARYSRAVAALYLARAADNVWPHIWQMNERGNVELMAFNGHNLVAVGIGYV